MSSPEKSSTKPPRFGLARLFRKKRAQSQNEGNNGGADPGKPPPPTWSMGILNDRETIQVPGSVLLLAAHRNEPLGLRDVHARTSRSSLPTGLPDVEAPRATTASAPASPAPTTPSSLLTHHHARNQPASSSILTPREDEEKKKTSDGEIILEPQPDDSANDPLNWPAWRRDMALGSLGIYCMIGGGITPLIAAGFTNVADTYHIEVEAVSLTTGLYMLGLGLGSVIFSPTAILYGKRPVYLGSSIIFIATSLWAAWSPSFSSLLAARVFQGIAVSPVECLPSATIAEIFFLHERAYRIGIYTLLLLGGKNLVPLVSAAIIGRFGWRWVFWITAMVVALCGVLLFFFVPETFWDRTPTRKAHKRPSFLRRLSSRHGSHGGQTPKSGPPLMSPVTDGDRPVSPGASGRPKDMHVGFAAGNDRGDATGHQHADALNIAKPGPDATEPGAASADAVSSQGAHVNRGERSSALPTLQARPRASTDLPGTTPARSSSHNMDYYAQGPNLDSEKIPASEFARPPKVQAYTHNLRQLPPQSFIQQLKLYNGRLSHDKWLKVMIRPFILFAYPSILWSAVVYACSIGWLIVISETVAIIYRNPDTYNFTALQTGLVYISPFVGGILGTGVAGKVSDIIVKRMSRRNGGMYEPEFRLVMAAPILVSTCIGLMGFGWSVQERDNWIVPTIFFGVVSFGCSLGSTTSITFCVDSYRQYAGEALVTLNFAKNVCHGLVFSLFVTEWLHEDGPKAVYIWIGIIQLIVMLFSIPMYIYGKRARMWTVRRNFMEKF